MEKMYQDDDEIEIDLRALFYELRRRWWLLAAALIAGAGIVWSYCTFIVTPQYRSEARLYVLSKETTLTSLADLQLGSQLTLDYKELVGSRSVLQSTIDHLNLDLTYQQLANKLSVENPKDTRFLTLTVTDSSPYLAKQIVDEIADTASDYIGDIMEMIPPKLIEDGEVTMIPVSPNTKRNTAVGGLTALLAACGIIALRMILNDTVKTGEDVERYLDLPVLAEIPRKKNEKTAIGKKDRKKYKAAGKRNNKEYSSDSKAGSGGTK